MEFIDIMTMVKTDIQITEAAPHGAAFIIWVTNRFYVVL
jgi:hypothetical protein